MAAMAEAMSHMDKPIDLGSSSKELNKVIDDNSTNMKLLKQFVGNMWDGIANIFRTKAE